MPFLLGLSHNWKNIGWFSCSPQKHHPKMDYCVNQGSLEASKCLFVLSLVRTLKYCSNMKPDSLACTVQHTVDGDNPAPLSKCFIHVYPTIHQRFLMFHPLQLARIGFCPCTVHGFWEGCFFLQPYPWHITANGKIHRPRLPGMSEMSDLTSGSKNRRSDS